MNIKEFSVANKPYEATLMFELYEGSDLDKKALHIIKAETDLFAEGKFDNEVFSYNITNKMSLRKYLTSGIGCRCSLYMIKRLMEAEAFFRTNNLDIRYMMYDSDLILVDKETEEISFIYVPATDHGLSVKPLRAYIKEILANAVYDEEDNLDFVGRLITYLNRNKALDLADFASYIDDVEARYKASKRQAVLKAAEPAADVPPKAEAVLEPELNKEVKEEPLALDKEPADPEFEKPLNDDDLKLAAQSLQKDILIAESSGAEAVQAEEISLSEPSEEPEEVSEQDVLKQEIKTSGVKPAQEAEKVSIPIIPQKKYPYLIRTKNQEIITIDKDEFKIGKIPGMADYLLSDNPAVSRMHAIIHNVDGTYYICDNYSTNATYLNGEKLEPGKNYLLINGVRICLANDEFTYIYEQ